MNSTQKLRVWHIPQVPGKPFLVNVNSVKEAKFVLIVLCNYDEFQYEQNIKPDYSSVSGLEYYDESDKKWYEWENEYSDDIWSAIFNEYSDDTWSAIFNEPAKW